MAVSATRYVFILLPLMTTMKASDGDGSDTAGLKGGNERSGGAESSFSQRRLGRRDVGLEWTGLDGLLAAAAADLNGALIGDIRGRKGGRQAG